MIDDLFKRFSNMNTAFYILFGLLLIFMWKNPEIVIMLFVALVFASSLNPLVDKLSTKLKRPLAASLILFGSIGAIAVIFIPIIALCAHQIKLFAKEFPTYINNINQIIIHYPFLQKLGFNDISFQELCSQAANYSADFIQGIMGFIGSLSSLSLYFIVTIFFTFFLMSDKDYIKKAVLKLFPSQLRPKTEEIIETVSQRIGGYVIAQLCAIISVWIVMTLGLMICKIPYFFLLGLITAILDIIPVIGPAIALIICLVTTYEMGIKALIIVSLIFALAQFIENNFVRPYAFGKLLNLHPMLIFIFLFIGTKYFGLVGTLFAPAIAATVCVFVEELYIKNLK